MEERLEAVRKAMEDYFGTDARRIGHALRVTGYAWEILETEPGDRELVLATALLHDIGIREAERKYGSSAGDLQEQEGPPVAAGILTALGYEPGFVRESCAIIAAHHSPGEVDSDNFRAIWDADWLVNLGDEVDLSDRDRVAAIIGKVFMTRAGRRIATRVYGKNPNP